MKHEVKETVGVDSEISVWSPRTAVNQGVYTPPLMGSIHFIESLCETPGNTQRVLIPKELIVKVKCKYLKRINEEHQDQ